MGNDRLVPATSGEKFQIGVLVFDNVTNLDFAGPVDMLSRIREAEIHLLAKSRDVITTDSGGRIMPDKALDEAPPLDMILVPGGPGTTELMEDDEIIAFLQKCGSEARWVTSVCTGALLLGAAGLLEGYRAVTHWTMMDALAVFGAQSTSERVVVDRNRITGAGVTAGMDFALTLIALLWGDGRAQLIQLGTEYDPEPPFNAGSPDKAPKLIVDQFRARSASLSQARMAAAQRAAAKLR